VGEHSPDIGSPEPAAQDLFCQTTALSPILLPIERMRMRAGKQFHQQELAKASVETTATKANGSFLPFFIVLSLMISIKKSFWF
jgi:hypothetical protein